MNDFHALTRLGGFRVLILTGACRSGRTTLGRLLASTRHAEHADEPWALMTLPVMERVGLIERTVAVRMMRALAEELFNECILLRNANFRRSDLSSVLHVKTEDEIKRRMETLRSRDDVVRYVSENDPILVLNLPESLACLSFFRECFPECEFIHVVRHGLAVASDIVDKGWLDDSQLERPLNNVLYHEAPFPHGSKKLYLPWWVPPEDAEAFLSRDSLARGAYYWAEMVEPSLRPPVEVRTVRYEHIKEDVDRTLDPILEDLRLVRTPKTDELSDEVRTRESTVVSSMSQLPPGDRSRTERLLEALGYEDGHGRPN